MSIIYNETIDTADITLLDGISQANSAYYDFNYNSKKITKNTLLNSSINTINQYEELADLNTGSVNILALNTYSSHQIYTSDSQLVDKSVYNHQVIHNLPVTEHFIYINKKSTLANITVASAVILNKEKPDNIISAINKKKNLPFLVKTTAEQSADNQDTALISDDSDSQKIPETTITSADITSTKSTAEKVVYTILVNGVDTQKTDVFKRSGNQILASAELLQSLRITLPKNYSEEWIDIEKLVGISAEVNSELQQINFEVKSDQFNPSIINIDKKNLIPAQKLGVGVSLNYDLNAEYQNNNSRTINTQNARFTPRIFSPFGVLVNDVIWDNSQKHAWQRIETYFIKDLPEQLQTIRIGDAATSSQIWGRSLRIGGVVWQSDFSLDPSLITHPLPEFSGQATLPSSVDIFVNGLKRNTLEVPSGPFNIPSLPIITGNGDINIVTRDVLGRETSFQFPFYASPNMLREGLYQFSAAAGKLRKNNSQNKIEYNDTIANASWRYGVTNQFTLETQTEWSKPIQTVGLGGVGKWGQYGDWNIALLQSYGKQCKGRQLYISNQLQKNNISVYGRFNRVLDNFCDLSALEDNFLPNKRLQLGINIGTPLGNFNIFGLQQTEDNRTYHSNISSLSINQLTGYENTFYKNNSLKHQNKLPIVPFNQKQRVISLNWSKSIARRANISLGINYLKNNNEKGSIAGQFNFIMPLGIPQSSINATVLTGDNPSQRLSIQKSAGISQGWGGYIDAALNKNDTRAGYYYNQPWVSLRSDLQYSNSYNALRLGAQGGIAYLNHKFLLSRQLGDTFAVINTQYPAVEVFKENQLLGKSDKNGRLIVGELRPFESNKISVNGLNYPISTQINDFDYFVRPYRGGGVVVNVETVTDTMQPIQLVYADQQTPLPVGARLLLNGKLIQTVGFDGMVYISKPDKTTPLDVEGLFGKCRLSPIPPNISNTSKLILVCNTSVKVE